MAIEDMSGSAAPDSSDFMEFIQQSYNELFGGASTRRVGKS